MQVSQAVLPQFLLKTFNNNRLLDIFNFKYHMAHHSDERPFQCDFPGCSNAYKTKADLRQHQKSHEKQLGATFSCAQCSLTFDSSTKLNVHNRQFHISKSRRRTKCDMCSKSFLDLAEHKRKAHATRPDDLREKWSGDEEVEAEEIR